MPTPKREEAGSLSKYEHQKLQKVYTQGDAAYGSVRNLVKVSNQPVSKLRLFPHSKPSYAKFTLETRKFKRMTSFARFENEFWRLEIAYVDNLTNDNNVVKYLLVRQDVFDITVDAEGKKTKGFKETLRAGLPWGQKKSTQGNLCPKGQILPQSFKKICKAEAIQSNFTMNETNAAFAARTIRSLKTTFYLYMEDYGCKYIHKLYQFVTTLKSGKYFSIVLIPKNIKNCDFLSIFYSKPQRGNRKSEIKIGDRVCIWKYDLPFRKC